MRRIAPKLLQASHVSTRNVAGTPVYMPPEYTQSGRVSAKTDTYAFGVVLLEMLTGQPPFHPQTRETLVNELAPALADPERLFAPHLDGRAKVELRVEQGGGKAGLYTKAGGGTSGQGNLTITLDGFSSPVSAGTFARRVLDGAFDGVTLQSSPYALSVTPPAVEGRAQEELPLEMLPYGEFEPIYGQALNIQDGEYPVLPMSVYGAVAMAHSPTNAYASSSDAFFIYKFDRQNMGGLGGLSFDEGQFTVVGYVTDGAELLAQLDSGDKLVSSRLVEGRDKLKGLPEPAPAPAVPEAAVPEVVPVAEAAAQ